jgi:transcriptional regulator with XRE-family HTH domain
MVLPTCRKPTSIALFMHYIALMDGTTSVLASVIGARVRQERQAQRLTLDQLAAKASVSRRMVINIEQGSTNASVGTLLRLSDALGIGLPALVEPPTRKPLRVTRAGEGAVLWSGAGGGQGLLVAGTQAPDVVELWDWTLGVGDRHVSEAHAASTVELLQVQDGTVVVEVGDQSVTLTAGDAVSFASDVAHYYANPGATPARFVLAVFEPGVGAARTERADA